MKTLMKSLSMIAICLMASMQFSSCSSSSDDIPEEPKKFNVSGKWMTMVVQPLDDMTFDEAKVFATSFQTPYIEFIQNGTNGTVTWYEFDPVTKDPINVAHSGTFTIKNEKITVSAPGNQWMNGTHTIESVDEKQGIMEWIVKTELGNGRFVFVPTVYNNLSQGNSNQ